MIPNHKGEIPVILLLLPFLFGIILGLNFFTCIGTIWLIAIFIVLSITFILFNLNYNRLNLFKVRWLGGVFISMILFLFGWIIVARHSELNSADHFSKMPAQHLVVKVNSQPILKNGYVRFTANVEAGISSQITTSTTGTLLISIKDSSAKKLGYGDELLIPGKYTAIDPPFNPAEFNYKKYLADKNIFYQAFLYPKQFKLLASGTGNPIISTALQLRQRLVAKLKANMHDTAAIAVASTLILGYRADLTNDVLQAYSKTGTVYVLTVSGAQVAILYFMMSFSLGFLNNFKHGKLVKALLIIGFIWGYVLLTGFSISVCRAALMVSFVIIGKSSARYINTLNILAVSAFLQLIYDPYFITEVGFQLSYLAVFGIIIFEPIVYGWVTIKNKWPNKLWKLCSLSIAIQLVILPLSVFYFHQFPVYFLVTNLLVVIPATVIMYTGTAFLLLPKIPLVSASLAFILEKTIIVTNKGLAWMENLPFATIDKLWITQAEYLLTYAIIISFFYFLYHKKVAALKLSLGFGLLLAISFSIKSISQSTTKSIAWLNLKKHTGIVFKNGSKAIVLSDLKDTDKTYLYSIQPYLDSCQVNQVTAYNLNRDISTTWLRKKYGLVRFLNTSAFIFNGNLETGALAQKLNTDYIYFTDNPKQGLTPIADNFSFRSLIIDGTNSDATIQQLQKQMAARQVNYKILKRNKSVISVSN